MLLSTKNLQSIQKITQVLPIKGYNHTFNIPLWFSSKNYANGFLKCIQTNYSQLFDLQRVQQKEMKNDHYIVDFLGTKNVGVFIEAFMLESNKKTLVKFPLKSANRVDFNIELSEGVVQGEYAITTSSSNKPILGTFGAGPCLIVAIYDKNTKTAFLAHVDGVTDLSSIKAVISEFNPKTSIVHLYGGYIESKEMCMDVFETFKASNFEIYNSDIVRTDFDSASLAIDSRDGKIYSPVSPFQLETPDQMQRLQLAGLMFGMRGLRKAYDGREDSVQKPREILSSSVTVSDSFFAPVSTTKTHETYCGFKAGVSLK